MRVVVLAGGTGGAKLASGFQALLPPGDLTVIANTADDDEFWGLLVSPDVDATIYRLAGVFDESVGYGQRGDTFSTLEALGRLGEPTWFRIGDRDLATHVLRAEMLSRGCRLTETALELCCRFGFVVVVGPSNPLISIGPILKVIGGLLPRERTVAVTPIVGGAALKGPTVEMLRALGLDASPIEVARMYRSVVGTFVLDARDAGAADDIDAMGYRVLTSDTVMTDGGAALAKAIAGLF